MSQFIQNLGWFIRRSPNPERLASFYHEALQLPILRQTPSSVSLWGGETTVIDILRGDAPSAAYADRNQARCYPVWRCYNYDRVFDRLQPHGAKIIAGSYGPRLAFFLDSDGNVNGVHERPPTTQRPEDHLAWKRHDAKEPQLEGIGPMPGDIQSIGLLAYRGTDEFEGRWRYFQDVVGLPHAHGPVASHEDENRPDSPINTGLLTLGDTLLLQVSVSRGTGTPSTDPATASNYFILRVHGLDEFVRELEGKGVQLVQQSAKVDGGRTAYFVDCNGHLIGLQERDPDSSLPEDVLSRQRWAERIAETK
jgi:predicted enzyme related to lactoylglutathione lyase